MTTLILSLTNDLSNEMRKLVLTPSYSTFEIGQQGLRQAVTRLFQKLSQLSTFDHRQNSHPAQCTVIAPADILRKVNNLSSVKNLKKT